MKKIANNIFKYIYLLFIILFSITNIFFISQRSTNNPSNTEYIWGLNGINILLVFVLMLIVYLLNKHDYFKLEERKYLIIFLSLVLVLGLYWIFSNSRGFYSFDDSRNCFDSAKTILSGNYTPLGYKSYLNTYPNNMSLVTYFMLIIRLAGERNAVTVIMLINLLFVIVGYLYLYKITSLIFNNRKTNMNTITLMFLSLQFVFFVYYVYGNVLSISLSFISIYYLIIFIKDNKTKHLVTSCISICFGIAMKNNVLIVLVAEIIYLIIETITKRRPKCLLMIGLMMVGATICTTGILKFWEYKANYSYDNKLPKICWVAYGFNYDPKHPGSYFDALERYHFENGYNVEFTKEKAKEFISNTLNAFQRNPSLVPSFYAQKMMVAWANPEYGVFNNEQLRLDKNLSVINNSVIKGNINSVLNKVWDATLSVVSIGLIIYIFKRRKEIELLELILAVVTIGGFLFHIFWELKSIYMYHYYLCLLPYAAHGLMLLFNKK